jgi:hypothetical protein
VRTDGNDNNSGFANTSADAFATISGAIHQIKTRYVSQNSITIRVADGTYVDGVDETGSYIASWNIVGNTSNPGNVIINATSVNPLSYPTYATAGRCFVAGGTANIAVSGMSFQSYYENTAGSAGYLQVTGCNFTAPVSGTVAPIAAYSNGLLALYGNCQYSGATAVPFIFSASAAGVVNLGYHDAIVSNPLAFTINGTPSVANSTAYAIANGVINVNTTVTTFSGGVPVANQYICQNGGGIFFAGGNTSIFPGTKPPIVTLPGWTA